MSFFQVRIRPPTFGAQPVTDPAHLSAGVSRGQMFEDGFRGDLQHPGWYGHNISPQRRTVCRDYVGLQTKLQT
ncbi:hypothetical protein RUESEDTHA_02050 [Ruegeria sp. THAF57]|nr:hypothetical protein RUESEDTHA_02050 [Ruegeria sp. THAF57]